MTPAQQSTDRQIRVFISSTFRDMQAERDILIKKIFPQLRKLCEERAVTWTEVDLRWGITDEEVAEGKVLPFCLEEIQRCRPYFIGLLGKRYGSLPREIPAELLERQKWLEQHRDKSITELEIIHGVLRDEEMHGHAYFYCRDPKYLEQVPKEKQSDFTAENATSAEKLERLKKEIRRACDEQVCRLRENFPDPEKLGEWILEDFTALIEELYPKEQLPDPLDQEAARHEAYARSRRLAFVGREDWLRRLNEYTTAPGKPLVLTGESGCGKSALLAEWVARWREKNRDDLIIQHYIGSTPDSADWQGLVRRILGELKRAFAITDDIPLQPDALRTALHDWTVKATGSRRVVLVLDALNQLADDGTARPLSWLPVAFPTNFRVLISMLEGESLEGLRRRGWESGKVPLFKPEEIIPAVTAFFEPFGRRQLPSETLATLVSSKAALNPLYLRAVLDELRQFGDNAKLKARAADYLAAPDLPELFDRILTRWHDDFGKDAGHPDLVRRSLCLIACARFGLSESELLDLLGKNDGPMPRRPWTPFYLAAENALTLRSGLLNFGHAYLRAAVHERWLTSSETVRAFQVQTAEYFTRLDGFSRRKRDELPWQLMNVSDRERLKSCVSDMRWFDEELYSEGSFDLLRYWAFLGPNEDLTQVYWNYWDSFIRGNAEGPLRFLMVNAELDWQRLPKLAKYIGTFLMFAGRSDVAETFFAESLQLYEKNVGLDSEICLDLTLCFVSSLVQNHNYESAIGFSERALQTFRPKFGNRDVRIAELEYRLGEAKGLSGEPECAIDLLQRSYAAFADAYGPHHETTLACGVSLGKVLLRLERLDEAEKLFLQYHQTCEAFFPATHPNRGSGLINLALVAKVRGKVERAEALCRAALRHDEETLGRDHRNTARDLKLLSELRLQDGDAVEVCEILRRCLDILEPQLGLEHEETCECAVSLADVYARIGWTQEAHELLSRTFKKAASIGVAHRYVGLIQKRIEALERGSNDGSMKVEPQSYHVISPGRLFFRLLVALIRSQPTESLAGQLKTLIAQGTTPQEQDLAHIQELVATLERFRSRLAPDSYGFLLTLAVVLKDYSRSRELEHFPVWQRAEPQSLDGVMAPT